MASGRDEDWEDEEDDWEDDWDDDDDWEEDDWEEDESQGLEHVTILSETNVQNRSPDLSPAVAGGGTSGSSAAIGFLIWGVIGLALIVACSMLGKPQKPGFPPSMNDAQWWRRSNEQFRRDAHSDIESHRDIQQSDKARLHKEVDDHFRSLNQR